MPHAMVVDDSSSVRTVVQRLLIQLGLVVSQARDGAEAVALMEQGPPPDVVITDLTMPRMSGLELLEYMAATPTLAAVPTLVLTTDSQPEDIRRARELGAKGWILKPLRPELLTAAVAAVLDVASRRGS